MIRAALLLGCLAAPASAACPVAGDLAGGGIRMVLKDGDVEAFRAGEGVLVESLLGDGAAAETRFTYARGVYLLESIEISDGTLQPDSRATFAFPMRPEETPEPRPGDGWGVRMVATYSGAGPVTEMLGLRFGPLGEVEIGGCKLAALPMEQRIYEDGEQVAREERIYLPDLGFSYAVAWHEDDRVDRYEYVTIEAME